MDSLEGRRLDDFIFAVKLAMIFLLVGAVLSFAKEWWLTRWINARREQRFRELGSLYFSEAAFSRVESRLPGASTVQRLVDDVRDWANDLVELQYSGITSVVSAILLGYTLLNIVPVITVAGLEIYGPMLWFSVGLFLITSSVLHFIGRRMPDRESLRANAEGHLRESLARTREYSVSISLQHGGEHEHRSIHGKMIDACVATAHLALLRARMSAATFLLSPYEIFAWIALSTLYFRGELSLGQVFQGTMAHAAMGSALGWVYSHYGDIARLRATNRRLIDWRNSVAGLAAESAAGLHLESADSLRVSELCIFVPEQGEPRGRVVRIPDFLVTPGEAVLLQAPSGFGKSLLFSVIAGVWPWASGCVSVPRGALWVPQRPFFPQADLRRAVSYPGSPTFELRELMPALERVNLLHLMAFGSSVVDWNNTLSGGELARLAIVRAVLQGPRWLFLDEPTAALDQEAMRACWTWLHEVPDLTIVAISHQPLDAVGRFRVIDLSADAGESSLRGATSGGDDVCRAKGLPMEES